MLRKWMFQPFDVPKYPYPLGLGLLLLSSITLILLLCSCTPPPGYQVLDLRTMPQEPAAYLDETTATVPLMDEKTQHLAVQNFLTHHFSPWDTNTPLELTRNPFWALEWIEAKQVFGHNLLPLSQEAINTLRQRCAASEYPSMGQHGISVAHIDVRALPTLAPLFNNPRQPGEGFPFDYMQHGVLPAGTPVLVTHSSPDRNWLFIETPLLYGWVPATAVARVDAPFKAQYTKAEFIALLKDGYPLHSDSGGALPPSRSGTILPLLGHTPTQYTVAVPRVNRSGNAVVERASVSTTIARPFPLPFTPAQIAALSSYFMQQPYSWGDRFSGRDCSGTMRDLFTPFGIWLPRNSGKQAAEGKVIDLRKVPLSHRREYIATHAIPFATLIHMPGHIMLYLGEYQGKSVVLHALWGVRHNSVTGEESRIIVGRTAITSLEPGAELKRWFAGVSSLLPRLDHINIPHIRALDPFHQLPLPTTETSGVAAQKQNSH